MLMKFEDLLPGDKFIIVIGAPVFVDYIQNKIFTVKEISNVNIGDFVFKIIVMEKILWGEKFIYFKKDEEKYIKVIELVEEKWKII